MLRSAVLLFLVSFGCMSAAYASEEGNTYLLILSSQRNAELIAEAARQFHQKYPGLNIQARSDVQLLELNDQQLDELFEGSSGVFAAALYGPTVQLLQSRLANYRRTKVIVNSDHRLVNLSTDNGQAVFDSSEQLTEIAKTQPQDNLSEWLSNLIQQYPGQQNWLTARSYWQAGGSENIAALFGWLYHSLDAQTNRLDADLEITPARSVPRLRWYFQNTIWNEFPTLDGRPLVALIDHAGGDRPADARILNQICSEAQSAISHNCVVALASWGEAGVKAVSELRAYSDQLTSVVMLQDFVVGAGEGRASVTEMMTELNVPVINAVKQRDRSAVERRLSSDGLAHEKVYYQVAMPELQGASQPLVIASAGQQIEDPLTGIRVQPIQPETEEISNLINRIGRWQQLHEKDNSEKRLAIIYYNHPPGRHNIGADNLDVPASLWEILHQLKADGYQTGELPVSQEALLDLMQERGVNLPRDAAALESMSKDITKLSAAEYRDWFKTLPSSVQGEMEYGPFGLLHEQLGAALAAGKPELAKSALHHVVEEMAHLLEGVDHPARERALALLEQLEHCYSDALNSDTRDCLESMPNLIAALQKTGIEGLGGWGDAPGDVMTYKGDLLLPGLQFGNIFIGPQPPRGWEINEELLHANLAFPPPHQYLAFYHYLRDQFQADAFVHLGRHSTYEFLPRRAVGLAEDDYSRIVADDIPGIYPYIVDGIGEGIQAKRRGLAVMVDHLTPPLQSTPLYDELLQLRQLIESFEANHSNGDNEALSVRLVAQIREKVDRLELKEELAQAMSAELAIMGISFDEVDDDMLVHEVGHYLTDLQERFMPLGLHIFGKDWSDSAVEMMLSSMAPENEEQQQHWQGLLQRSPSSEMDALLDGLSGGYIDPGPGNDPIRSPQSLPTGRNFYALDGSLIPSRIAWEIGKEMAQNARAENPQTADKREALVLWASDVVRDEGVMIAFGLDMLGVEPVWNSRGLVVGLKLQPLDSPGEERIRRDTLFTTSGLFRDLYGAQMTLLNQATLMALDASSGIIAREHPALALPLQNALQRLAESSLSPVSTGGMEPLSQNQVAQHWIDETRELMAANYGLEQSGVLASMRVFGDAPGTYGAGINRLVERSGAWENREELAEVYMRRLGHAYGGTGSSSYGAPAQDAFKVLLDDVENTYFGRSSNLYGLIDNNDAFDYLGGLSLAVETLTGSAPNNFVIDHASPNQIKTQPLGVALRQELRGRFLNPEWLEGLMDHGYAGARTMGSEFFEYLWGWQVTNPTLVGDWAWEEVKAVYMDDRYQLGLDEFLEEGHNVHVKSNMLAVMLVAVHKGFWEAEEAALIELASEFAELVAENGLPGSGHTDPDNPMLPWLEPYLSEDSWQQLAQQIDRARPDVESAAEIHRLTELELSEADKVKFEQYSLSDESIYEVKNTSKTNSYNDKLIWIIFMALVSVMMAGFAQGLRQVKRKQEPR